ncbi:1,4-alpha-glucan branching protein GlgB [uncultured Cetobacterium sp.]|uniref:1,4-alpha-glucan branching protein GlgB n=1 Tax=uncultured Cetobacterium sp. TaxID=527638 RepID=UPI002602C54D|nr:1,4-alpha-glucan branching protein GlgB [uncultured Cetobacterium sp.]
MNYTLYKTFGSHLKKNDGVDGVLFTLWAPNAMKVSVVGDFNDWNGKKNYMNKDIHTGVWTLFIPNLKEGTIYKYMIADKNQKIFMKSDPFAFYSEVRPNTASIVYNPFKSFPWEDEKWLEKRASENLYSKPISIYELHLGSWKRNYNRGDGPEDGREFLNYREIAKKLVPYILETGFTHIEILPLTEHPLDTSWGYQGVGYFSITSRYGSPEDFKYLVNECHKAGIGVILDWVPGHFCKDAHGLYRFDGTPLFEYENEILGENPTWGTANFDFTKPFVRNFLLSSATFLFEHFHIDGIRADAVSNLLYLEYGREKIGLKNSLGGDAKLEAIDFLRTLNETIFKLYKNPLMIAEEATSWPLVTAPTYKGGLGFNYKWNMGWMNDMLKYMSYTPCEREKNHNLLTFSIMYAFSENFILALSHDEVVHGKKSLLDKMSGDYIQKFDSLRMFYGFMFGHPGKKLLFMGGEFGQFIEWRYYEELEWKLLKYPQHDSLKTYVSKLNEFYKSEPALWGKDSTSDGFQWVNHKNHTQKLITFIRKGDNLEDFILVVCNFTKNEYINHSIGVPRMFEYMEVFNSDKDIFGGSNQVNSEIIKPMNRELDDQPFSISINIAPLCTLFLKPILKKGGI